ncbi:acyl-CoA dehydrogenase [Xylophilus sp. GOD-11R]|uniref:acyl-CoA dehydrogenase n=1 Tax=Xylophilus sp. GOD-11R TaxID=3089814 RepID=UPI00298C7329|nr:acyl-CoA dehydrogenase [Xylophilus sp. GOD-11R]WPB55524.1 acyl-CoA dehydrogenase [Xylophilus sp. GOD-11R]
MSYTAPVQDLLFDIAHLADLDAIAALPGFEDAGLDTADAVLTQCARFAEDVVAPLNASGDRDPPRHAAGEVTASPGFAAAYRQFVDGGWQGLAHPPGFGGQGLPCTIAAACAEMLHAADLSFALCPMLTDGAIDALLIAGSEELKSTYLPRLVSGEWTGTMNLTEPQAGSDLSQVRTRADDAGDGSWRLFGTKIFITWGEHDMAGNVVHLVLARIAGAPEGVKGISLFLVPKFIPDADGRPGVRNDVRCQSIEHKLGIRASPTAVLQFGGNDGPGMDGAGARGWLVGEPNRGLETMFIMMNSARYAVGIQGVAVAGRAYQKAVAYARERVQGRPVDGSAAQPVAIVEHPDVRRLLMTVRALVEGARAMACVAAAAHDRAIAHPDAAERTRQRALHQYLVPLVKGFSTEMSLEATSLSLQVFGGMGFIEETGIAQHYRDARILTIYEGTTAIQANDLVGRKTVRDGGAAARAVAAGIAETEAALKASGSGAALAVLGRLSAARWAFEEVVDFMLEKSREDIAAAYGGSVPYLMLAGNLVCGWQMARALLAAEASIAAGQGDNAFLQAKVATAVFYAAHLLPRTAGLREAIVEGADAVGALATEAF